MAGGTGYNIVIPGLSPSAKVPGANALVRLGQGPVNPGSLPRYLLVVGTKLTSGSLAVDTAVVEVTATTDLDALLGNRSEAAAGVRHALKIPGVKVRVACPAEAGGAVSATATITFTGTLTGAGTYLFFVAGHRIEVNCASGDTPTQQATKTVTAFGNNAFVPCTATNAAGVVTLTIASAGARGNHHTLYKDDSLKPAGGTVALGTTSTYSVRPGDNGETGVRFGGGTGTDDVTNLLATLSNRTHFTIAVPHTDATNLGRWKAWNATMNGIGVQRYQSIVCASNDLESVADPIATSTLNDGLWSLVWCRGSEDHPIKIAAAAAALFQQYEQIQPNTRFDGFAITGLTPQRASIDRPTGGDTGEQSTRLDNGVTPLTTTDDGQIVVVRAITTLCRKAGVPFDGCVDRGQMRVPYAIAELVILLWLTEYAVANPFVADDPAPGEQDRAAGVATPSLWKSYASGRVAAKIQLNWILSYVLNTALGGSGGNKQMLTQLDVVVTPQNHRLGLVVNQVN